MMSISFTEESDVEHDISKMFSELDKAVAKEKKKLENEKLSLEASDDNEKRPKTDEEKKRKYEFSASEAAQKKKIKSSPEKKKHEVIMSDSESERSEDDEDEEKKAKKRREESNFALDFPKIYVPIVKANNTHNKRIMCPFVQHFNLILSHTYWLNTLTNQKCKK